MINTSKMKAALVERNISQSVLAKIWNVSRQQTNSKLNGKAEITFAEAALFAALLKLTPAERDAIFFDGM